MGKPRSELSKILHSYCDNVYFQPSADKKLTYPCIIYNLENVDIVFADNGSYRIMDEYSITYITRDPDDSNIRDLLSIRYCSLSRSYPSDNLHHYAYRLYF